MASAGEVVVFTDTNIDTHIAMAVSPDISAADFKRELERTHFSIFPKFGEIKACVLLVRRKTCFYHLTESLPIKYAFQGLKGTWFLRVEVQPSNYLKKPSLSRCLAQKYGTNVPGGSYLTDSFIMNTKKKKYHNSSANSSTRYDSQSSTMTSVVFENQLDKQLKGRSGTNYSNKLVYPIPEFAVRTTPPSLGSSGNKLDKTAGVGRRILTAANNLRLSRNKQKPVISFYRLQGFCSVPSVSKISVYEISDNDV